MGHPFKRIFLIVFGMLILPGAVCAQDRPFVVERELSEIAGSIKYTVVGRYSARFEEFEGEFFFDPNRLEASYVNLRINADSISSRFATLDRIVRSPQILDTARFSDTVFRSTAMVSGVKAGEYVVTGELTLHGVTREITFPFLVKGPHDSVNTNHEHEHIMAQGTWVIPRKDFDIYWSRWLDKGGILVGNHMTVDWKIIAFR